MVNKYKNEVSSLTLSDSFKADLKEKMAKELSNEATTVITVKPWVKYSKYIASAACLALILATMGIVSLFGNGLKVEKAVYDDAAIEEDMNGSVAFSNDIDNDEVATEEAEFATNPGASNGLVGAGADDGDDTATVTKSDDASEDEVLPEDAVVEEDVEEDVSIDEPEDELVEDAPVMGVAPEGYDGEYISEDYALGNSPAPEYNAETVSTDTLAASKLATITEDDFDDIPPATEEEEQGDIEAEEEVEEEDVLEYIPYIESDMTYSDLCITVLDDMEVNFVRFKVEEVYSPEDAIALTGDDGYGEYKTLYKVNITNDYIAGDSVDYTINLSADGTEDNQLVGRPVMVEGDVFAACIVYENGVGKMLDQLIYQIHRLNGVDIAYHLGYENVNPGDTDMGILPFETSVITSTLNNPARYTHKASLKELYRYLRRNWNRQEYTLTDLEATFGSGTKPVQEGTPVEKLKKELESVDIKIGDDALDVSSSGQIINMKFGNLISGRTSSGSTSSIMFTGAMVTFRSPIPFGSEIDEITLAKSSILPITINGVGIGNSLEELVSAFNISSYVDGRLTFRVVTKDPSGKDLEVLFEVNENVITDITIK